MSPPPPHWASAGTLRERDRPRLPWSKSSLIGRERPRSLQQRYSVVCTNELLFARFHTLRSRSVRTFRRAEHRSNADRLGSLTFGKLTFAQCQHQSIGPGEHRGTVRDVEN